MSCNPITNITPPALPSGSTPGGFAPSLPSLPLDTTPGGVGALTDLFNLLSMPLPGGTTLKPNLSETYSRTVSDAAISIFEKFAPILSIYSFFMPALNIVLCIIEVICSIPNPFKLRRAVRRLHRNCLPEFLSMFPAGALVAMILAFLNILSSIVEALIQELKTITDLMIKNLHLLTKSYSRKDSDSIQAITKKLSFLICQLQNYFSILLYIATFIDVYKALINKRFNIPPCSSNGECCTTDVCPDFLKNNPDGIHRVTGTLKYFNAVQQTTTGIVTSTLRGESWQFFDQNSPQNLQFSNITHAYDLPAGEDKIFFPQGVKFVDDSHYNMAPYTVNLRLYYNPLSFGITTDVKGPRFLWVKNCMVATTPTDYYFDYDNSQSASVNGNLQLVGGTTYEDDGVTLFNNAQTTLSSLIHTQPIQSNSPALNSTDGYAFQNVEYLFSINYDVLLSYMLITLGCVPDVAQDIEFINNTITNNILINSSLLSTMVSSTYSDGNKFPDVNATITCINASLATLQQNVSVESVAAFQTNVDACLSTLSNDINSTIDQLLLSGFNQYTSVFIIAPELQFTTQKIKVSVSLNDNNGTALCTSLNSTAGQKIAARLKATPTLGKCESFTYDGYSKFIGYLSSTADGSGTIKVSFDNKTIGILTNPSDITQTPSVKDLVKSYTFISSLSPDSVSRRDESDVANG